MVNSPGADNNSTWFWYELISFSSPGGEECQARTITNVMQCIAMDTKLK